MLAVFPADMCGDVKWPVLDTIIIKGLFHDQPTGTMDLAVADGMGKTVVPPSQVC